MPSVLKIRCAWRIGTGLRRWNDGARARSSGNITCRSEAHLIPNPIQFSRDVDLAILAEAGNLQRLTAAFESFLVGFRSSACPELNGKQVCLLQDESQTDRPTG